MEIHSRKFKYGVHVSIGIMTRCTIFRLTGKSKVTIQLLS